MTHKTDLGDVSKMLKDALMVGRDSRTTIRAVLSSPFVQEKSVVKLLSPEFEFPFCFCCVRCVDNIVGCSPPWDGR